MLFFGQGCRTPFSSFLHENDVFLCLELEYNLILCGTGMCRKDFWEDKIIFSFQDEIALDVT